MKPNVFLVNTEQYVENSIISKYENSIVFSVFSILLQNKSSSIYISALIAFIVYSGVADKTKKEIK